MSRFTVCRRDKRGRWTFLARFGYRSAFTKHPDQALVFTTAERAAFELLEDDEVVRDLDLRYTQQEAA